MFRLLFLIFSGKRISLENKTLKIVLIFTVLFWYSASGFLFFELPAKPDLNWFDAVWWSVVTMATVGYGDLFPVSLGGRFLVGMPTILIGIGLLTVIVSQLAVNLIESQSRRARGMADIRMKGHTLVINYSTDEEMLHLVGEIHADPSTRSNGICIVDDTLAELPRKLTAMGVVFVKGNPSSEAALKQANLAKASRAIILSKDRSSVHSDDRNLAIAVMIEKLNPDIFSLAEVSDPQKTKVFELAGCNSVVCLAGVASNFIVKELLDPGMKGIFDELLSNESGKEIYSIPLAVREGLTFRDLVLWGLSHNSAVVGIVRGTEQLLACAPTERIREGDKAVVIADDRIAVIDAKA